MSVNDNFPVTVLENDHDANVQAPVFKIKLGNTKGQRITIFLANCGLQIIGRNSDEVTIEAKNYTPRSKSKEGLKPVYNQVEDNTNLGLQVLKENNNLKITQATLFSANYILYVPKNVSIKYQEVGFQGEDLTISGIDGEIEAILKHGGATISDVPGPVVVNSSNGDLKVTFNQLNQNKPSAISSINGSIDIAFPSDNKADLTLKSMRGEIYTDFPLTTKEGSSDVPKITGGHSVQSRVNGGGTSISATTINNDIFIRKRK
jgi:hypothetical protein